MAADRAIVSISASLLPDEIKTSIGGTTIFDLNDVGDNNRWLFVLCNVAAVNEDLIPQTVHYIMSEGLATAGTSQVVAEGTDDCVFLFVKHTGTSDGTNATTHNITINLNNEDADATQTGSIVIKPNECWFARLAGQQLDDINAAHSGGGGNVQAAVYAIVDDGGGL